MPGANAAELTCIAYLAARGSCSGPTCAACRPPWSSDICDSIVMSHHAPAASNAMLAAPTAARARSAESKRSMCQNSGSRRSAGSTFVSMMLQPSSPRRSGEFSTQIGVPRERLRRNCLARLLVPPHNSPACRDRHESALRTERTAKLDSRSDFFYSPRPSVFPFSTRGKPATTSVTESASSARI
jgi:hypothetical protein